MLGNSLIIIWVLILPRTGAHLAPYVLKSKRKHHFPFDLFLYKNQRKKCVLSRIIVNMAKLLDNEDTGPGKEL